MSGFRLGSVDYTALDPDQRSNELAKDLPRAHLGKPALAALWLLRIYVLIAVPLIIYVFLRSLRG